MPIKRIGVLTGGDRGGRRRIRPDLRLREGAVEEQPLPPLLRQREFRGGRAAEDAMGVEAGRVVADSGSRLGHESVLNGYVHRGRGGGLAVGDRDRER